MSNEQLLNGIPTEEDLDKMEDIESGYVMSSYKLLSNIDEEYEDVSYLSALCNDTTMDAYTRKYLMEYNDKTGSKSAEELYIKQVIMGNNKTLEGLAKRLMEYEQQLGKE